MIYILEDYDAGRVCCVTEDLQLIRKYLHENDYFQYHGYLVLSVWKNGKQIEIYKGMLAIAKINGIVFYRNPNCFGCKSKIR